MYLAGAEHTAQLVHRENRKERGLYMIKKKILSFALAVMTAANLLSSLAMTAQAATPIANLVSGGDMSGPNPPTGFAAQASATTNLSIEDGVLKIVGTGAAATSAIKTGISLTSGNTYVIEAKMKSGSGNQTINMVSAPDYAITPTDTAAISITESWTTVRAELTVTATNKQLKLKPTENTTTWYIDDVEIYDITNAYELTVPDTVTVTSGAVEYDSKYLANPDSTVTFENADAVNTTLSGVGVTDASSDTITVSESNGTYSFTMPASNATIAATANVAPFELDTWELEASNTGIDPFKTSIWLDFSSDVEESTLLNMTGLPAGASADVDTSDPTKVIITLTQPMEETHTYTIDFSGVEAENGVVPTSPTSISFTTAAYPQMTFAADWDGDTDVARDTGELIIESSHDLDESTVTTTNITISPAVAYDVDKTDDKEITITLFEELAENTTYTISVSSAVESSVPEVGSSVAEDFTFTSGAYPVPNFVSSSVADGATNVTTYTPSITFNYDVGLSSSTANNTTVTVSPAVDYTATASGNVVIVTFNEQLAKSTTYTVSVTDGVKSSNNVPVVAKTISFTTDAGFENMVENGGFDTDVIGIDDAQSMTLVSIVELDGERVLRWKPSWNSAPLYAYLTIMPGHRYFMSAKIKSDTAHTVAWQANYQREGDSNVWKGQQAITTLTANADFVTISAIHSVPSSGIPAEGVFGSFRLFTAGSGGLAWVDDFMVYDMTLAPAGTPSVVSYVPANGTTELSPFTDEIKITFDKPMDPTTLGGISINNGATIVSRELDSSFTECTLKVSNLAVNKTYTVSVNTVKSMYGDAVTASSASFSTWTVSNSVFGQAVTGADNMDQDAKLDAGVIHLVFTDYVDATTLVPANFTVSYTVGGGSPVSVTPTNIIKGEQDVKLVLPANAILNDATYTVALSSAIKSMTNVPLTSSDVTFTTKGAAAIESNFTSINSIPLEADRITAAQNFMENDYKDMLQNNDLYDSILAGNNTAVKNAIYADLANNTATTQADIVEEINDAIVVAMANNSATDAEAKELILSAALGLDNTEADGTNIINVYNNTLTATQRAAFDTLINGKTFTSTTAEGIRAEIAQELVLFTIGDSESWEPVQQAIENSKAYFGTDAASVATIVTNTNSYGLQASVYRPLQGYTAATNFAGLYSQLNAYYTSAVTTYNQQQYVPQGGGGGGFSGPAAVTNTDLAQNEQKDATAVTIFGDLGNHSWAVKAIDNLYARGIVSGKAEGAYAPGEDVTRNEFVKMMVVTVGKYDKNATVDFADLPSTHWSYAYVASAVNAGLVNGIGEGLFGTDGRISRQDVAVLVYSAVKDKNIAVQAVADFKDIDDASDYAKDAVTFLRKIGVVAGDENGNYNPQSALTRAEAAVILNAVLEIVE